jgi:hypothetical protein
MKKIACADIKNIPRHLARPAQTRAFPIMGIAASLAPLGSFSVTAL